MRRIPNLITLANLLAGCLAILSALKGNLLWASYLIVVAMVLDFADGMAARMLGAYSEIGKQLDSLADLISFGLAPAFILFRMLEIGRYRYFSSIFLDLSAVLHLDYINALLTCIPFLYTLCAAWRLAKFNIDPRQKEHFIGLPTPAAAMVVASLPLILLKQINVGYVSMPYDETVVTFHNINHISDFESMVANWLFDAKIMLSLTGVLSVLMVSTVSLISLKFTSFGWKENAPRYILLLLSAAAIAGLKLMATPVIILLYIVISVIHFQQLKIKGQPKAPGTIKTT
ncbi:MAG: CDP-alcohol phosphatidyltransferase family protein [Flavobacteriales bacterium]|nr:CDP-alcohol phosphatidyltransferase family protein [Flavobacteriales bacterium]MCB9449100.1 CDP-alcohol phosphatidyltransferase family protein [Flavobacteriales bacterium]